MNFLLNILLKVNALILKAQRTKHLFLLKQNPQSNIHPSFRLGNNNYLDISPSAKVFFNENTYINESNNLALKKDSTFIVGKNTYITRATIAVLEKVEIGENCILGEGLKIFDHNHQVSTNPFAVSKTEFNTAPIKIGNNVWTGANCIILKGVTIGDNVILGAGCVIHKDIPANSIIINKQEHIVKSL